jgi:hypothetical protein
LSFLHRAPKAHLAAIGRTKREVPASIRGKSGDFVLLPFCADIGDMSDQNRAAPYVGLPMTLGNMRANGVRALFVYCPACHHQVNFNVDGYGDDIPVPTFAPRMLCSLCGLVGAFNGRSP